MSRPVIGPLTDKQLVELKTWLEPWFRPPAPAPGSSGWRFNQINSGGWGEVEFDDFNDWGGDAGELGLLLHDYTRKGIMLLALDPDTITPDTPQPTWFKVDEGQVTLYVDTDASGLIRTIWDGDGITSRLTGNTAKFLIEMADTGETFTIKNHLGATILETLESGVTSGTFDGGGP